MIKRQAHSNRGHSTRPRGGKNNKRKLKIALLASVPVIAIGLGVAMLSALTKIPQADEAYCYGQSDQHQAVISLDNSFLYGSSKAQTRDYRNALTDAYENAPPNARVSIFTTANDVGGTIIDPVFTICKPAEKLEEQETIGAPSKPAPYLTRIAQEAEQGYLAAVDQILADAQDQSKAAGDSPILETLQSISRHKYFSSANRSLTVITDGIQNSEIARFCVVKGDMPHFELFEKRPAYAHVQPKSFSSVRVIFLLVEFGKLPAPNAPYCTNDELRSWWPDYFTANGAADVQTSRLRFGAAE